MPESLRDVIEDIQKKLKANAYQNEEHVRLSLVARVVQALGWDIWNPGEVATEFQVVPDEDRTKVDMALFAVSSYPAVFIEIKAVGKMEGNLPSIEAQVRDYTRNITTPFAIITDGKLWRFYYVKGDGSFGQKLFDSVDLSKVDTFHAEKVFESYLSKTEVRNGNSENEAKKKLNVTQVYLEMANCFPNAQARTLREPYPNLPDAIILEMSSKGYTVTRQEAVAFIRSRDGKQVVVPEPVTAITSITNTNQQPSLKSANPSGSGKASPQRPVSLILDGRTIKITKANEILKKTADYLVSKGRLTKEKVPVKSGTVYYLVNIEPVNANGRPFEKSARYKMSNGFWLNTNFNHENCLKRAEELLARFLPQASITVEWQQ